MNRKIIEESIEALKDIRSYFNLEVKCMCNEEDGTCERCMYIEDLRLAIQRIRNLEQMNNKELFRREYMCDWVKQPYREDLIKLLVELYNGSPIIKNVIGYIRQNYYSKENQPYRPTMENILNNNSDEACYQIIKVQNEKIKSLENRLENQVTKKGWISI